ncbi:putative NADPH:adrenodoxin oxidoreductase [Paramyrothecium foliicola]|nr:putative NADPH:adrenodoxin oxidoreductase [Paramyrothecium foliicola]
MCAAPRCTLTTDKVSWTRDQREDNACWNDGGGVWKLKWSRSPTWNDHVLSAGTWSHEEWHVFGALQRHAAASCIRTLSTQVGQKNARSSDTPFRMAVIGSGPAGFYTAYRVMSKLPNCRIDMYEALPVPFGLVRYGVAPDHPENCRDKFEEVASSPNFAFLGNVSVGKPGDSAEQCSLSLDSLTRNYDSVLLAYGASEDKKLGIPGEANLSGIHSAREFVGWYNGLPDCAGLIPNLAEAEEAVIIGQGNVALDVARMLLEDIDVLRKTDITEHALEQLARSRIKRVHVASFTIKEVRELMKLSGVAFHPIDRSLLPEDIKSLPRVSKRLMEVVLKGTSTAPGDAPKSWSLDNCLSPKHFVSNENHHERVASTVFEATQLESPFDPKSRVTGTGRSVVIPSDVVFRSVGYKSVALAGFTEAGIQFDDSRGVVDNDGYGRVTRLVSHDSADHVVTQQVDGFYCAGWVKRGPTGVIASTMEDAFATGDAIVQDWLTGAAFLQSHDGQVAHGWDVIRQEVPDESSKAINWEQWHKIDQAERERGRNSGKEREKFVKVTDMLAVV